MSSKSRKNARAVVQLVARYRSPTVFNFVEEECYDLSTGGMFIKSPAPAPAGTLLKLECDADDGEHKIRAVARVVWARLEEDQDGPVGMGVKFIKVDAGGKELIEHLIAGRASLIPGGERYRGSTVPPDHRLAAEGDENGKDGGDESGTSGQTSIVSTALESEPAPTVEAGLVEAGLTASSDDEDSESATPEDAPNHEAGDQDAGEASAGQNHPAAHEPDTQHDSATEAGPSEAGPFEAGPSDEALEDDALEDEVPSHQADQANAAEENEEAGVTPEPAPPATSTATEDNRAPLAAAPGKGGNGLLLGLLAAIVLGGAILFQSMGGKKTAPVPAAPSTQTSAAEAPAESTAKQATGQLPAAGAEDEPTEAKGGPDSAEAAAPQIDEPSSEKAQEAAPEADPAEVATPTEVEGAALHGKRYLIHVVSRPAGARVTFRDTKMYAPGDIDLDAPPSDERVVAEKAGYHDSAATVSLGDFEPDENDPNVMVRRIYLVLKKN